MLVFPWREQETVRGRAIRRPMVDVCVEQHDVSARTKALIDSGAPRCVFPRGIGDLVGIDFPELPHEAPTRIQLLGREWFAVSAFVDLQLLPYEDEVWTAEVDFVMSEGLAFALLGLDGFLDRRVVTFNAYNGYFVVERVDDYTAKQPLDLLSDARRYWPGL